jgi:hypothetical protein
MLADHPDRLREWFAQHELAKAAKLEWRRKLRRQPSDELTAAPPFALVEEAPPHAPRLRQNDVTVEKVAELLANASPKGLLIVRDELAGWVKSMNAYGGAGRQFWLEAYGGRPYRVERKTNPNPIVVPRLVVSVYGGIQPERLRPLLQDVDDGLMGRFLWVWPEPVPFHLGQYAPNVTLAIRALDRLRELDLFHGSTSQPIIMPLVNEARHVIADFGRRMQHEQLRASGPVRSTFGKARGHALRLALVIEMLWWCSDEGTSPPPKLISTKALRAACQLVRHYFIPMAQRSSQLRQPSPRSTDIREAPVFAVIADGTERSVPRADVYST